MPDCYPKSSALDFAVKSTLKTLDYFLEWPLAVFARWQAGTWTLTQMWTLLPDQQLVKVLSVLKSQNNMCEVWILFRSTKEDKIEASKASFQPLKAVQNSIMPQTFTYVHINKCQWLVVFVLSWHPLMKALIVPEALHVPCSVDVLVV